MGGCRCFWAEHWKHWKAFFQDPEQSEYSSSPAILKLSGKGHMSCQSLEIWQVVQQDNQPPEPEEPQEPREPEEPQGPREPEEPENREN